MLDNLRGMAVFASVVRHGSFSGAAKELGITTSAVSQQIRTLENELGVVLMHRSTRKLSLTEAGASFYESAQNVVKSAEKGWAKVHELRDELAGTLRIATTPELGVNYILPALSSWFSSHDELSLNILAEDRYIDMIEERVDVAIRLSQKIDKEHVDSYHLADVPQLLLASPTYLQQHGAITTANDLNEHQLIGIDIIKDYNQLQMTDSKTGKKTKIKMPSRIATNNVMIAAKMASQGHGIVRLLALDAKEYLSSGELVEVLPNYQMSSYVLYAVTQKNEQKTAKVSRCLEVLETYFKNL